MKPIALAMSDPRHAGLPLAQRILFGVAVLLAMMLIGVQMTRAAGIGAR